MEPISPVENRKAIFYVLCAFLPLVECFCLLEQSCSSVSSVDELILSFLFHAQLVVKCAPMRTRFTLVCRDLYVNWLS